MSYANIKGLWANECDPSVIDGLSFHQLMGGRGGGVMMMILRKRRRVCVPIESERG